MPSCFRMSEVGKFKLSLGKAIRIRFVICRKGKSYITSPPPTHCDQTIPFMYLTVLLLFFVVLDQLSLALPAVPEVISSTTYSSLQHHQKSSAGHEGNQRSNKSGDKQNNSHGQGTSSQNSTSILGAAYFITNKANNTIVVSSIGNDGKLTFAKEVPTGGKGLSASGEADALFSQDSIIQVDGVMHRNQRQVLILRNFLQ